MLYANLLVIVKRNKFENQRKLIEVFNLRSKVVTCFNTLQSCCYPQRFPIMFSAIISRFCYLAATKKPNYWRKTFEVSKVKFELVFHSFDVHHITQNKRSKQQVLVLFVRLHETLVPLFSVIIGSN